MGVAAAEKVIAMGARRLVKSLVEAAVCLALIPALAPAPRVWKAAAGHASSGCTEDERLFPRPEFSVRQGSVDLQLSAECSST